VIEEVHLSKEVTERIENVHDTVRRTEVDVEEIGSGRVPQTTRRDL
jgi:stress response protein YsnF